MDHVGKNLTVRTGSGDDTIDLAGVVVDGETKVKHGKGMDAVTP